MANEFTGRGRNGYGQGQHGGQAFGGYTGMGRNGYGQGQHQQGFTGMGRNGMGQGQHGGQAWVPPQQPAPQPMQQPAPGQPPMQQQMQGIANQMGWAGPNQNFHTLEYRYPPGQMPGFSNPMDQAGMAAQADQRQFAFGPGSKGGAPQMPQQGQARPWNPMAMQGIQNGMYQLGQQPPRSQTRSPGIGMDGRPVNYRNQPRGPVQGLMSPPPNFALYRG